MAFQHSAATTSTVKAAARAASFRRTAGSRRSTCATRWSRTSTTPCRLRQPQGDRGEGLERRPCWCGCGAAIPVRRPASVMPLPTMRSTVFRSGPIMLLRERVPNVACWREHERIRIEPVGDGAEHRVVARAGFRIRILLGPTPAPAGPYRPPKSPTTTSTAARPIQLGIKAVW